MPENDLIDAEWAETARQTFEGLVAAWNAWDRKQPEIRGAIAVAWGFGDPTTAKLHREIELGQQIGLLSLAVTPPRYFEIKIANFMGEPEFEISTPNTFKRDFPTEPQIVVDFLNYCQGGWEVTASYFQVEEKVLILSVSTLLKKMDHPIWLGQRLSCLQFAIDLLDGKVEGTGLGDLDP